MASFAGRRTTDTHRPVGVMMKIQHPIFRVVSLQFVGDFIAHLTFDDDSEQVINFELVLYGPMYEPLRDPAIFKQARIDPEVRTLVWPNGADFDPATLHDWPQYSAELAERARKREFSSTH